MAMSVDVHLCKGFLLLHVTGAFSLRGAEGTFIEMLQAARYHGMKLVLVDCLELVGAPSFLERFLYAEFTAKEGNRLGGFKLAYVMKEPLLDSRKIGETVARNRGLNVRVFENPQDAIQWLAPEQAIGSLTSDSC